MKLSFPLAFVLSTKTSMERQLREHMSAIGLALTVVDAVYLVRDWNKAHPTLEAINEMITGLESDRKTIQFIQTAKAATDMAGGGVAVLHTIGQTLTAGATHAFGTTLRTAGATTVVDNQLIDDIIKAILTKSAPKEVEDNEFD
ncbi:unnamed protein product [Medioppia subpectinata]|uniref:Uncharacterized protein n=1 Tax=Medioppia subpectinata TaxID=1979941 RepID=A0A7R9LKV3_9ACAR|nr:unnamed protein product [Medioppia subpectinata]CAG2119149.1 unnamed protein product [Medioppia subpectinata]